MSEEIERTIDGAIENRMTDARNRYARNAIIEECARVIEQWENDDTPRSYLDLIAAIRALKDGPKVS